MHNTLNTAHVDWNARCVYLITSRDGGVLFDLDNDEFLKLDPIAVELWALLSEGRTESDVAEVIAQKYAVEPQRVAEDLRNILRTAAERDITPECVQFKKAANSENVTTRHAAFPWYGQAADAIRPKPGRVTVIRAFLALALFDLTLSTRSLKALCKLVSGWRVKMRGDPQDPNLIGRICTAVERACVWYPKKALCLQRSAVTTCLLRGFGFSAEMVVAARVMPMLSHAWVQVDGSVVNDHARVKNVYQALASF